MFSSRAFEPRTAGLGALTPALKRAMAIRWLTGLTVARLLSIVPSVSPDSYARLAGLYVGQGRDADGAAVLALGVRRYPDSTAIQLAQARLVYRAGQSAEAARAWTGLLAAGVDLAPGDYRDLARALRDTGQGERAEAHLGFGLERWPDEPRLLAEKGRLALAGARPERAVEIFEGLIGNGPEDLQPWIFRHLAEAHVRLGDHAAAEAVLHSALGEFPGNHIIELAWARVKSSSDDAAGAAVRWLEVASRHAGHLSEKDFVRVIEAQRRASDLAAARHSLSLAQKIGLSGVLLDLQAAQIGMAEGDWAFALRGWQRFADGSEGEPRLPLRGTPPDWSEVAWHELVQNWESASVGLGRGPSPGLYGAIVRTLQGAALHQDALMLLRRAMVEHPHDRLLAFRLAEAEITRLREVGTGRQESLDRLIEQLNGSHPSVARVLRRIRDGGNTFRLLDYEPNGDDAGLGRLRILRVPTGSSLELEAKAGRYLAASDVVRLVRELSSRERWEESHSSTNVLLQRAHRIAQEYGSRFAEAPWLPADTLADAALLFVYHELALSLPMERVAQHLSQQPRRDEPVFIESPGTRIKYLDGYTFSRFDVVYLYYALRRRGVNAYLCVIESGCPTGTAFTFAPSVRFLRPRGVVDPSDRSTWSEAIYPAGIRSVHRLNGKLPQAVLYSSGSVIKEFAYDRSLERDVAIRPQASVHPDCLPFESFDFDLVTAGSVSGTSLVASEPTPTEARFQVSEPLGGTWLEWLDRAIHGLLKELSIRATAEVSARGIEVAHVCDHIFPDAAVFSEAVKRAGGRVVLWPHSANPVHVGIRREGSFDEVYAVTRRGVEAWRSAYPGRAVHRFPSLMLGEPVPQGFLSDSPLSIVVLGGRPSLGDMPVLDLDAHERSYRDLFEGLDSLSNHLDFDVWFKPRGLTGEHELWLHNTVGRLAKWRTVYEHPLRMSLPNMLFVTVSTGSSALIEGLSRGIPGLVVRDFPVRDYTAFADGTFPVLDGPSALSLVRSCCEPDGLRRLLEVQLPYYLEEMDTRDGNPPRMDT